MGEDGVHAGHDIVPINEDGSIGPIAEGDVENGPVFGDIDLVAAEHAVAPIFDLGLPGQIDQKSKGFIGNAVFGKVQQNIAEAKREFFKAFWIPGKQIAHVDGGNLLVMRCKRLICGGLDE